jgi:competence protein ComGC
MKISDKFNLTTLALTISCLILLISLIVAVAYWNSSNTAYNILESQTSAYVNDHSHTNQEFENLKSQFLADENQLSTSNNQSVVNQLQNAQSELSTLENFDNTTTLVSHQTVSPSGSYYSFYVNFSGYISLTLSTSGSSTNWYAQTSWVYESFVHYNQTVTFGANGYGFNVGFPVLGSPNDPAIVKIVVGNTAPINGASATVDITYTY